MDHSIGIDLGGTFTKLALVSQDGSVLARHRIPTETGCDAGVLFRNLAEALAVLSCNNGVPFPPALGCGIGVPGVVDYRTGHLSFFGALGWKDLPLSEIAQAALNCEVFVDTDVNAGALADLHLGCARDGSDVVYISWGTGIGAGLVVSRKLYHSRGGAMGNFGHMPADPESSRLCYCGCYGCLEIEAGGKAMCDHVRKSILDGESTLLDLSELTPQRIADAAGQGDTLALRVLHRSARLMARSLAGLLALLNPDTVVFGGGVSRCFDLVQDTFAADLQRWTPPFSFSLTRILRSSFGEHAGVVGAALLGAERAERGLKVQ